MDDELKDLLSHARALHFSLLGAAFAILVVTLLGDDPTLQRANEQLGRVAALNDVLSDESVANAVRAAQPEPPPHGISVHEQRQNVVWVVDGVAHPIREAELPLPRPVLWIPAADGVAYSPPHDNPGFVLKAANARTLRDFQNAWAFMLSGRDAFVVSAFQPERATFATDPDTPAASAPHYPESLRMRTPNQGGDQFMVNVSVRRSESDGYVADFALVGGQAVDPHWRYGRHALIPIETAPASIDLISKFLETEAEVAPFERVQLTRGFAEAFPELASASAGLESLTIEELRAYVGRQLREEGPTVDLFGASIPRGSLIYWSLPALLALQIYLLVTLRQFRAPLAEPGKSPFPWIALFEDQISRTTAAVSFFVAPVVAAVVVVRNWAFVGSSVVELMLVLAVLGSIAICWLQLQTWRQLNPGTHASPA